jgi:hypothetical protein
MFVTIGRCLKNQFPSILLDAKTGRAFPEEESTQKLHLYCAVFVVISKERRLARFLVELLDWSSSRKIIGT